MAHFRDRYADDALHLFSEAPSTSVVRQSKVPSAQPLAAAAAKAEPKHQEVPSHQLHVEFNNWSRDEIAAEMLDAEPSIPKLNLPAKPLIKTL